MVDKDKQQLPSSVTLSCAEGGCCPQATFRQDGSLELAEFGQCVKLTASSLQRLVQELARRGLLP